MNLYPFQPKFHIYLVFIILYQVVHSAPQASNDYAGDLAKRIIDDTAGVNWTDEEKKSNSTANVNKDGYIKY